MFSYISGKLIEKTQDSVVIDVCGIGFKIYTSASSLADSSVLKNERVVFHTFMYIKEGIMDLYGFSSKEELELFELLITVNGVGAKGAVSILSVAPASKICLSILTDDVATIKKASGIGAKTAQRICLDLKDKIKNESFVSTETDAFISSDFTAQNNARSDAVSALITLGYTNHEAQRAVSKVEEEFDDAESYIKKALKNLL
ncbi:MAG: Holliday junction branch migration protein RuvA [Clostridia bacterium]|nr:Holliday junction branch migration protein RuvA [Clostridia bacterium]